MSSILPALLNALSDQRAGKRNAHKAVGRIADLVRGPRVYRDDDLTAAQVSAVEILLSEWTEMFSFPAGRPDALDSLIQALQQITRYPNDADIRLRTWPSWRRIVELRGPGRDIEKWTCDRCQRNGVDINFGEFVVPPPIVASCGSCGHVEIDPVSTRVFKPHQCKCGGQIRVGCPLCEITPKGRTWLASPWEYFANHTYEIRSAEG